MTSVTQERYFLFPPEIVDEDVRAATWQVTIAEQDFIASIKNVVTLHTFGDGTKLVNAAIGPEEIKLFQEVTGLDNIFCPEAVEAMGIQEMYVGRTLDDVFARWPELAGQVEVVDTETGETTMKDIISRVSPWALA